MQAGRPGAARCAGRSDRRSGCRGRTRDRQQEQRRRRRSRASGTRPASRSRRLAGHLPRDDLAASVNEPAREPGSRRASRARVRRARRRGARDVGLDAGAAATLTVRQPSAAGAPLPDRRCDASPSRRPASGARWCSRSRARPLRSRPSGRRPSASLRWSSVTRIGQPPAGALARDGDVAAEVHEHARTRRRMHALARSGRRQAPSRSRRDRSGRLRGRARCASGGRSGFAASRRPERCAGGAFPPGARRRP